MFIIVNTACYDGDGANYRGSNRITKSGRICQDWASQSPHRHSSNTPERQVRYVHLFSLSIV